jgi:hypothetical protein
MAETPEMKKPDFRNGFPISGLGEGSMISGQADGEELVLGRRDYPNDDYSFIPSHFFTIGTPLETISHTLGKMLSSVT